MLPRLADSRRLAPHALLALLTACLLFTLLVLNQPRLLGIQIPLPADGAVLVFPRPLRTALVLAVAPLLCGVSVLAWRHHGPTAARNTVYDRLVWSLAPLALAPLAVLPPILRGVVPDVAAANILFYLPVALLATVAVRLLSLAPSPREGQEPGRLHLVAATALFALFSTLAGWHFTREAGEHSGDEGHYLVQAISLSEDHDLDLANNLKRDRDGEIQRRKHHVSPASRGGHVYSWHPFGLSLLLWPAMGFGLLARHLVLGVIAALGVGGMVAFARCCHARASGALFVTALFALGPLWGIYASRALPEVLGATLLLWFAVAAFSQVAHPWTSVAIAAFCCSALPWVHTRFIPLSLLGGTLYLLAGSLGQRVRVRLLWRLGIFSGLCALGGVLYIAVMWSMFEGAQPYPIGSWLLANPAGMWQVLTSSKGVLYSLPMFGWLLAASVYAAATDREARFPAQVALLHLATVVVTSCGTPMWFGGDCLPGRFLLVATPLLVGPAARIFDRAGDAARWWLAFLGIGSCLTFFLVLLRLPVIETAFGSYDSALPEALPLLKGWLQPLPEPGASGWPVFAIALYGVTALLLAVRSRRIVWQGALMIGVAAAAAHGHRQAHQGGAPLEAVRSATAVARIDLSRSLIMARGLPSAPTPLLDAVDLMAETRPVSVTTSDLGVPARRGLASRPRLDANDWADREYRWALFAPAFPAGRGRRLFRVSGRIEGEVTLAVAVREGALTLLEQEIPTGPEGRIDFCRLLETEGGEVSLFSRLTGESGAFLAESLSWAPCDPPLLAAGGLVLPEQCR